PVSVQAGEDRVAVCAGWAGGRAGEGGGGAAAAIAWAASDRGEPSGRGRECRADAVARAEADGHTLLMSSAGILTINEFLYEKMASAPLFGFSSRVRLAPL